MKLLVNNLNSGVTEEDLSCLLGDMEGFLCSSIIKDRFGIPEGRGYVNFATVIDGKKAILKYNGYLLMGKAIEITQERNKTK